MFSKLLSRLRPALVCTISLFATASMAQSTINVGPGQPYTTIQSGIDAASNGDTVLVAPGTYNENISFKGKAITVTSSGGASVTTIDGGNKGGVATVLFSGGETSSSVISGFTIRGGGDTIFSGNSDGGVYVRGGLGYSAGPSPTIKNNIITANNCHNIDVEFASPTILNNEISGVLQSTQGTGSEESYCGPRDAIYLGGTSNFQVGGTVVVGNTIENNLAGGSGIEVFAAQHVLVMNNVIRNNYARSTGSAFISVNTDDSVVVQNLIYGNTSTCGGALSFNGGILIANNTIVDNVYVGLFSGSECTAIAQIYPDNYSYGQSYPNRVILNNVISGNTSYPAVNCSWYNTPSESLQPTFQNNILYNAGGPFFGSYCVDVSHEYNNIVADPQFVSPSTGDYHLKSTSPAIDAGSDTVLQTFTAMTGRYLTTDFDGNPRVQDATGTGCTIDMGAYEYPGTRTLCSTSETLTSSPNPSSFGQTVTFTAQLASASGVPTGDVQFSDGSTVLGIEAISNSGVSTFSTGQLSVGSHNITATYQPTGNFPATTASVTQVVNGYSTTTTLNCSPASISISQTAQLVAPVTSANGTPTGSIAFTDNGAALSSLPLSNGVASLAYVASAAGVHTLTATYIPTGSFGGSSASCSETVTALPSTSVLSVSPAASSYGSPVTLTAAVSPATPPGAGTPTGTVTFFNGGSNIGTGTLANGVATLTLTTLPAATDNLTCTYGGSTVYAPSSCNTVPLQVNGASTALSLTASPNPAYATQAVTLTATVAAQGITAQPNSGTVTFFDGSTSLGTQPVSTSGTATLSVSSLTVGTHPITATFNPANSTFLTSTSPVVNEQILPSTFTIALGPSNITLKDGATGTVAIQLASVGNFAGPLSLSYGTLPANATASINPATVTLTANGTSSSTLTINTLLKTASNRAPTPPGSRELPVAFAALALLLLPARRKNLQRLLGLAFLAFALQAITGCTNSWYTASSVSPGTYQLPVTATDANHNSQTATLTVTVTPNP